MRNDTTQHARRNTMQDTAAQQTQTGMAKKVYQYWNPNKKKLSPKYCESLEDCNRDFVKQALHMIDSKKCPCTTFHYSIM